MQMLQPFPWEHLDQVPDPPMWTMLPVLEPNLDSWPATTTQTHPIARTLKMLDSDAALDHVRKSLQWVNFVENAHCLFYAHLIVNTEWAGLVACKWPEILCLLFLALPHLN